MNKPYGRVSEAARGAEHPLTGKILREFGSRLMLDNDLTAARPLVERALYCREDTRA